MFWCRVTLLRNNYVLSPNFLENRLFNRLTIFPQAWNLFTKILRVFLHLWMVKVCFGLCWLKSYGHFTIFRSVRIFVNRTENHPFAILSESNHLQMLLWIERTLWVHFQFLSFAYIIIITKFYLRSSNLKIGHLRQQKLQFFFDFLILNHER